MKVQSEGGRPRDRRTERSVDCKHGKDTDRDMESERAGAAGRKEILAHRKLRLREGDSERRRHGT